MITSLTNDCFVQHIPDSMINILDHNVRVKDAIIKIFESLISIRHSRFNTIIPQVSPQISIRTIRKSRITIRSNIIHIIR